MILKVEDASYPYGWSYFNGVMNPSVSGRVPLVRYSDPSERTIAFLSEEEEKQTQLYLDAPRWSFDVLHWMIGRVEVIEADSQFLAVQWRQGAETHVLVTRRSAYLMSDDGKTIDRL